MCTIMIEALTPLDQTSSIKLYKNGVRSRPFSRIAKMSIVNNSVKTIVLGMCPLFSAVYMIVSPKPLKNNSQESAYVRAIIRDMNVCFVLL